MFKEWISSIALIVLLISLWTGCSTAPPEGIRIDFEAARTFKPFRLQTLDGETRTLDHYLNKATLVSFFFPT